MTDPKPNPAPGPPSQGSEGASLPPHPIVVHVPSPPSRARRWLTRALALALLVAVAIIGAMYWQFQEYFAAAEGPTERFHSGDRIATDKIALLEMRGTIMPPLTERLLKAIKKAEKDERVKGLVLVIDSPGGLVADSHQIYHRLQELREKKPIVVSMKRMAASGGYYIAMGAGPDGKIFAEPTTWTGSIGVIIPRYNAQVLAGKVGVDSEPIKTGIYKDSLSPFRDLNPSEQELWATILNESFEQFLDVIATNREPIGRTDPRLYALPAAARAAAEANRHGPVGRNIEDLATGQIFTARQALAAGLIDEIGYEDDAVEFLKKQLGLKKARVVSYLFPKSLWEVVLGNVRASGPERRLQVLSQMAVPRAMYYCSGLPVIPIDVTGTP